MSAAIGAALKKIAVALLTDKKVLKTLGMAILVLIVALLLPLMAMMALLSGDIELDTGELMARIEANLSASDLAMLTTIEDTMEAIDKRVFDASADSEFRIRIKCPQCRNIVEIDSNAGIKHQALALLPKNNDFRKCG